MNENVEEKVEKSWQNKSDVIVWAKSLKKLNELCKRNNLVQLLVDFSMIEIWYHSFFRVEKKNSFHRDERSWSLLDVCETYDVMKISKTRWIVSKTRFWNSEFRITAHRRDDEEDIV